MESYVQILYDLTDKNQEGKKQEKSTFLLIQMIHLCCFTSLATDLSGWKGTRQGFGLAMLMEVK
jgi:hypothetical protein